MRSRFIPERGRLVASVVALTGIAANGYARTASAVDDFSNSVNTDSSEWSYRYTGFGREAGFYPLLPGQTAFNTFVPNLPYWNNSVPYLGVAVNRTGGPVELSQPDLPGFSAFPLADQTIWMHPSDQRGAVVSWLSPADGAIDIEFDFASIDPNGLPGDGVAWRVDRNITDELRSGLLEVGSETGRLELTGVPVLAGDRINFVVTSRENDARDSTALRATITLVPEPACAALIVPLLTAGVCGHRR